MSTNTNATDTFAAIEPYRENPSQGSQVLSSSGAPYASRDIFILKSEVTANGDTITLPDPNGAVAIPNGRIFTIKAGSDTNATDTITIDTEGGVIDGVASKTIVNAYGYLSVMKYANDYWVLAESL